MLRLWATASLLSGALLVGGCSKGDRPRLVQATGVVLLNGQPCPGATVMFEPIASKKSDFRRPSWGVTDDKGQFRLSTYTDHDGVPRGKYRVGVDKRELVGPPPPPPVEGSLAPVEPATFRYIVPEKYATPATSGLEVEVTSNGLAPSTLTLTP